MSGTRRKPGRLGLYVEGYRARLLELGYSPLSVTSSLTALGHLGRWMEREHVDVDHLDADAVMAFLAAHVKDQGRLPTAGVRPLLRVAQGADSQAIRLEGDRVAHRLPLPQSVLPLLAQAPDGLWTVSEDSIRHRYAALRLDPDSGEVPARVDLGIRNPTGLLPVGDEVWITASDGTVTVIGDQ